MSAPMEACTGRLVPLTRGLFALVDDEDYGLVSQFSWSAVPTSTKRLNHYAVARVRGRVERMHRLIAYARDGQEVDHGDGDGLNNSRRNLTKCTRRENMQNVRRDGIAAALSSGLLPRQVVGYVGANGPVAFPQGRAVRVPPPVTGFPQAPFKLLYKLQARAPDEAPPLEWRGWRCGTAANPGMVFPFVPECEPEQGEGNWP